MTFCFYNKSNLRHAYTIVAKLAYALSLGHSSRGSYKLFKVSEQPWMKDDNKHLASELSKKSATSVSQGEASPGHKISFTELTTQIHFSS